MDPPWTEPGGGKQHGGSKDGRPTAQFSEPRPLTPLDEVWCGRPVPKRPDCEPDVKVIHQLWFKMRGFEGQDERCTGQ